MRRSSIVGSLLILALAAASSPLSQQSQKPEDGPLSQQESNKIRELLERQGTNVDEVLTSRSVLQERQTYNCTDLEAAFDSRCWNELNLSGFLMDPDTGWNHTVRVCSEVESAENNDGSDCCKQGEPWTTCFLRLAHGTPGQDCSQINSQFCSYQSALAPSLDPAVKPQYQYIMKNIYGKPILQQSGWALS